MKTGINMASVNRIKELAEEKEFWEALDLVEEQDLEKSYNPQFLRLCGEIYLENGRYDESRKALIRAHIMAPEGNRVIYELVRLYLHMGLFNKAQKYYEQYEANATKYDMGKVQLIYLINKAKRVDVKELLSILLPISDEEIDDKWIFELAMLYAMVGRIDKAKEECNRLMEFFKGTRYSRLANDLIEDNFDIQASFNTFPTIEALEPEEKDEYTIKEEEQLIKDYERLHPKDPVILSMEDDEEEKPKSKGFKLFKKKSKDDKENELEHKGNNEEVDDDKKVLENSREAIESNASTEDTIDLEVKEEIVPDLIKKNDIDNENIVEDEVVTKRENIKNETSEDNISEKIEKLEELVNLTREEDMRLPSYDDISITNETELEKKYKDREIGADGIDEVMLNELPETAILLKKLMSNQKHIAKELEEKQLYGTPLTDEYIEQLEKELEEDINSLAPLLESQMISLEEELLDDEFIMKSVLKEMNATRASVKEISNKNDISKSNNEIEDNKEESIGEELEDDLLLSDTIDSTEIVKLYDMEESVNVVLQKEKELQEQAKQMIISLGIEDVSKFDINEIKTAKNEILKKYASPFERNNFAIYLKIDNNKVSILTLLKHRRINLNIS